MKTTALAVGLAVALAVATVSTCQAEKEETYLEAATHFCSKFGISPPPLPTICSLADALHRFSSTRRDDDHQQQAMRMGGDG